MCSHLIMSSSEDRQVILILLNNMETPNLQQRLLLSFSTFWYAYLLSFQEWEKMINIKHTEEIRTELWHMNILLANAWFKVFISVIYFPNGKLNVHGVVYFCFFCVGLRIYVVHLWVHFIVFFVSFLRK